MSVFLLIKLSFPFRAKVSFALADLAGHVEEVNRPVNLARSCLRNSFSQV